MNPINYDILGDALECFDEIDSVVSSFGVESESMPKGMAPMFYPEFRDTSGKILYVGINPSLTGDMLSKFEKVLGDGRKLHLDHLKYLQGSERDEAISRLIDFQAALKGRNEGLKGVGRIDYFSKIDGLHREAFGGSDVGWEHFDLFSYRFTQQKYVEKAFQVKQRMKSEKVHRYFISSMMRFVDLVENSGFRGVVVLNAAASRYIKNKRILGLDRLSDQAMGKIILSRQVGGEFPMKPSQRVELAERMRSMFALG
jgi:hypothetical protein